MTNTGMDPVQSKKAFIDRVLQEIERHMGPLIKFRWNLELFTVIYPIELAMRLWYHLDPRVYSEALRIRRISEGRRQKKGNRHVLFVLYTRHTIPAFTR